MGPHRVVSNPRMVIFSLQLDIAAAVGVPSSRDGLQSHDAVFPASPAPGPSVGMLPRWAQFPTIVLSFLCSGVSPLPAVGASSFTVPAS